MTTLCSGPCSSYATLDELCDPCYGDAGIDPLEMENNLAIASDLIYEWTAKQFSGTCRERVRPCDQRVHEYPNRRRPHLGGGCICACPTCTASPPNAIRLGFRPVSSIISVKVDGDTLDPSLYRVDDFEWLVRLPDPDGTRPGWPMTQDMLLASTELDTFEVDFTYGIPAPRAIVRATAALACELALACRTPSDDDDEVECRLPRNVVSVIRQGVAINLQDALGWFTREPGKPIRTGLWEVDAATSTYNPAGLSSPMAVLSPDVPAMARRANTWPGT